MISGYHTDSGGAEFLYRMSSGMPDRRVQE